MELLKGKDPSECCLDGTRERVKKEGLSTFIRLGRARRAGEEHIVNYRV